MPQQHERRAPSQHQMDFLNVPAPAEGAPSSASTSAEDLHISIDADGGGDVEEIAQRPSEEHSFAEALYQTYSPRKSSDTGYSAGSSSYKRPQRRPSLGERRNSLTPSFVQDVVDKRRSSGNWNRLSELFYRPPSMMADTPPRSSSRRHPSLRRQVSNNNFGWPLPPGGFAGLGAFDLASSTNPGAAVAAASSASPSAAPSPSAKRQSNRHSHYVRAHPLERTYTNRESVYSTTSRAERPKSQASHVEQQPRESGDGFYDDEEEDEDQQSRDFVTAASIQAEDVQSDENTPGEVWLKNRTKSSAGFMTLLKYATPMEVFIMCVGFFAALCAGALRPVVTVIFGQVADNLTYDQGAPGYTEALRHSATSQALIVLYMGVGSLLGSFVFMIAFNYTGESISRRLRVRYFQIMLGHDFEFFDRIGTGEMTSRMMGDLGVIQEALSEKLPLTFVYLSNFVAGFVVAFAFQWKLALSLLAMLPCIFASFTIAKPFIARASSKLMDALSDGSNLVDEVLSSLRIGRAFSTERIMSKLYGEYLEEARTASLRKRSFQSISVGVNYFCVYAGYALAFFYGTLLITRGEATPGDVVTSFFAVLVGSLGLASIAPCIEALGSASAASNRVHRHLGYIPRTKDVGVDIDPSLLQGNIEFQEVSFAYPLRPSVTVLKNFSLTIPAKKTVALVGASGSGKSSAIGLLERFYDNYSGDIMLDNINVKQIRPRSLRSKIGLVTQEPILFNTTIFDNVSYGLLDTEYEHADEHTKRQLVEEACVEANAHDFVMSLGAGYDTRIAERGGSLSGGQRQRLALARALVSKPSILLLDEATAALDSTSEEIVQEALNVAASTRTCITVAHRLSTIRNSDIIVVMHQGLIVEQGNHYELMEKRSYYYDLVTSQDVDRENVEQDDPAAENRNSMITGTTTLAPSTIGEEPASPSSKSGPVHLAIQMDDNEEKPAQKKKVPAFTVLRWIMSLGWSSKWFLIFGLISIGIFGLLYPAVSVVLGYFMQAYADGYANGVSGSEINSTGAEYSLYLFIIAVVSFILYWAAGYFLAIFAETLGLNLRKKLFLTMLALPLSWHDHEDHSPSALVGELTQLPQSLMGLTGATLQSILESLVCIVAGIAVSLAFGWKLALVTIATIPVTLALGISRVNTTHKKTVFAEKELSSSSRFATECLAGIQTVQSLAAEREVASRFEEMVQSTARPIFNYSVFNGVIFAGSSASLYFVVALTFWYGMYLLASGEYDVRAFYLVFLAIVLGSSHTTTIFLHATSIAKAWTSAKEAYNICHEPGQVTTHQIEQIDKNEKTLLLPPGSSIDFNSVTFKYPAASKTALNQMCATIHQGQFVGIVGPSGSGKSTLISLLERFYEPNNGVITVNGSPMETIDLTRYRDSLALVPQEPALVQGSIRFNISLGARSTQQVTDEDMLKALEAANIAEFVQNLPEGLDTDLGGRGVALSGGQRQRLAIARALLRDPEILLLDEYTAALDAQSEKVVHQTLMEASKGRTTVAIAHRIASIQHADVIFVLENGQIVEMGSHSELMNRKEKYYDLAKCQILQE